MASITSANAVLLLSITDLFSTPQQLQQFAADDIYDIDAQQTAETAMGVDGYLAAGFVWSEVKQKITLQADSPSNVIFEQWNEAQKAVQDIYRANGSVTLKSVNRKYTMINGVLTSYPPASSGKRVLQARTYEITWQRINPAPMA